MHHVFTVLSVIHSYSLITYINSVRAFKGSIDLIMLILSLIFKVQQIENAFQNYSWNEFISIELLSLQDFIISGSICPSLLNIELKQFFFNLNQFKK